MSTLGSEVALSVDDVEDRLGDPLEFPLGVVGAEPVQPAADRDQPDLVVRAEGGLGDAGGAAHCELLRRVGRCR